MSGIADKKILLSGISGLLAAGAGLGGWLIRDDDGLSVFLYIGITVIGAVGLILAALGITATVIAWKIRRSRWKYKEREHDAFLRTYNQAFRVFTGLFSERLAISLLPLAAGFSVAFAGWRFNRRDAKALDG